MPVTGKGCRARRAGLPSAPLDQRWLRQQERGDAAGRVRDLDGLGDAKTRGHLPVSDLLPQAELAAAWATKTGCRKPFTFP
jgi:hypothetical protein